MEKVGIVTCHRNHNYGSMLQAYATYSVLKNEGYDCEFIEYIKKYSIAQKIKFIPRLFNMYLMREKWRLLEKKIKLRKYPEIRKNDQLRQKAYDRFVEKYYQNAISLPYVGYDALKKGAYNYDTVLAGSDQLWLPAGLPTNFYNLMFAGDGIKKVAYSTSFGVSKIPFYQVKRTKCYLNRIDWISVRENSGKKIIKDLIGKDVEVVLDPTLLLDAAAWEKVIPAKKVIDEPYIFCYFLGSNPEHRKQAQIFSKAVGMKLVDMPHIDEFVECDVEFNAEHLYDIDSEQFVNLIRHAEYVLTDSFHCTVFSILHHKKFMTFDRYSDALMVSRNSRISTLCEIAGLNERRFKENICLEMGKEIDYEKTDKMIAEERLKSMEYLRKALGA